MAQKRVLMVDDDTVIRRFVGANLQARGFDILTAESGEDALDIMARKSPDLVILDVMMDGIDGIEVCRRIREKSTVPVMMLSARVDMESQTEASRSGADYYICKPFAINDLVSQVRALLNINA